MKSNAVILKRHMILKIIVVSFFQRGGLQMGRLILVSIGDSAQVPSVSEKKRRIALEASPLPNRLALRAICRRSKCDIVLILFFLFCYITLA